MRRPGVPHPADLPNRLAPPSLTVRTWRAGGAFGHPAFHGNGRSGPTARTHQISLFSSWKVAWPVLLTRACICISWLSSRTMYVNLPSAELRMSRARFPDG